MNEGTIKSAVLMAVRRATGRRKKPVVTAEFSLGSSPVRADLAILGDEFVGVEIKGDGDSLRRLPAQMQGYARYFERTILVVANRHIRHVRWTHLCGAALWSFDITGELTEVRAAGERPSVIPHSYVDMMTKDERRRFLLNHGPEDGIDRIGQAEIGIVEARAAFIRSFQARYGETSRTFWSHTSRRPIQVDDLAHLSRFSVLRNQARKLAAEREAFWHWWGEQNSAFSVA